MTQRAAAFISLVLLLVTLVATARAEVPDLEVVNRVPYGGTYDVAACGDTLYFMDGSVLRAVDVSDPSAPVNLGETDVQRGWQYSLGCSGNAAYVLADDAIFVYDFSIPWEPELAGSISTGGSFDGLSADDSLLAVWGYDTIQFYGLDSVIDPQLLSSMPTGSGAKDLELVQGFAYVVGFYRVDVVDLNDPTTPEVVSSYAVYLDADAIEVADGWVYLRDAWDCDVVSFDSSNPVQWGPGDHVDFPEDVICFQTPFVVSGSVLVVGVADGENAPYEYLQLIDVADPLSMELDGRVDHSVAHGGTAVELSNQFVAVADTDHGVRIMDPSVAEQPANPLLIQNGGSFNRVERTACGVATSRGNRGLAILNNAALPSIDVSGGVSVSGRLEQVSASGTLVAASRILGRGLAGGGVVLFDVSNPLVPAVIEEVVLNHWPTGLAIDDTYLVASNQTLISLYDITLPSSPVLLGGWAIPIPHGASDFTSAATGGGIAYVNGIDGDGWAIDLAMHPDPDSVVEFDGEPVFGGDLVVSNHAMVLVSDHLKVFDLGDPMNPVVESITPLPGTLATSGAAVWRDSVLIAGDAGLLVVDVEDPTRPEIVAQHAEVPSPIDVTVEYPYFIVSHGSLGIAVYVDRNWVFSDDFESGGLEAWSDAE